jgi:hypothetical protein
MSGMSAAGQVSTTFRTEVASLYDQAYGALSIAHSSVGTDQNPSPPHLVMSDELKKVWKETERLKQQYDGSKSKPDSSVMNALITLREICDSVMSGSKETFDYSDVPTTGIERAHGDGSDASRKVRRMR